MAFQATGFSLAPVPAHYIHLGSEPAGRQSISLSLSLSASQTNELKKKKSLKNQIKLSTY